MPGRVWSAVIVSLDIDLMVPLRTPEEFPATTVLHAKIKVILRLERMIQRHDERVIAGGQNFLLCQSPFDFIAFDHLLLAQYYVHVSEAEATMTKLIDLILSKLPGPTSTFLTFIEFEL